MKLSPAFFFISILSFFALPEAIAQNVYDTIRTVKLTAEVNLPASQLTLNWEDDLGENTYSLYKKNRQDTTWGMPLSVTDGVVTSYVDTEVEIGKLYEYRMVKQTGDSLGYAYLFSGIDYQPPRKKGDVLLLVDSAAVDLIAENLTTYEAVLISEGWKTWVVPVAATTSVAAVKAIILDYYAATDSLTTLVLMGDIAVPHSGEISPDGHANNHRGAWPADVYYGDMDGVWTDETVDNVSSTYPRLHNVPNDGNFDQDEIPGEMELAVGRLDFSELPVYENLDEYELLNRYLEKNIEFRTGEYRVKRQAVFKNINPWQEGLGQFAIRNFVPLVSNDSLVYNDFFDAFYDSFLWSYGAASGSQIASTGLGTIYTYADNNFQAVFTAFFGSYFGDYDFENNLLRTILASGKVLSTAWVGAPNWYFHPMAMGHDLGYCTLLTQNNVGEYYTGVFPQYVTINLLGDPTLNAFIVRPPSNLVGTQNDEHITLNWTASSDDILGYQVLKKGEGMDYFEATHDLPILATTWTDSCVVGNQVVQYLVKAVKRETTPSGTFINQSTGPIIALTTDATILPTADFSVATAQGILKATNHSLNANQFEWLLPDGSSVFTTDLEVSFTQGGSFPITLIASNNCFSDTLEVVFFASNAENLKLENAVKLYPNPSQEFLNLELTQRVDELHLYNSSGMCLLTQKDLAIGNHQINLTNISVGSYVMKLHIGGEVLVRKILVE